MPGQSGPNKLKRLALLQKGCPVSGASIQWKRTRVFAGSSSSTSIMASSSRPITCLVTTWNRLVSASPIASASAVDLGRVFGGGITGREQFVNDKIERHSVRYAGNRDPVAELQVARRRDISQLRFEWQIGNDSVGVYCQPVSKPI